jgi:hypothetical protein
MRHTIEEMKHLYSYNTCQEFPHGSQKFNTAIPAKEPTAYHGGVCAAHKLHIFICTYFSHKTGLHLWLLNTERQRILKSSDDGVCQSGSLGLWISSTVRYSKERNVFGNWICFRRQVRGWETPTVLGMLERANLNHWATPS